MIFHLTESFILFYLLLYSVFYLFSTCHGGEKITDVGSLPLQAESGLNFLNVLKAIHVLCRFF